MKLIVALQLVIQDVCALCNAEGDQKYLLLKCKVFLCPRIEDRGGILFLSRVGLSVCVRVCVRACLCVCPETLTLAITRKL